MPKSTKGASAPVLPINPNTLCNAIDLLDEAYAIATFVTGVICRGSSLDVEGGGLQEHEQHGFHIVMHDMAGRIKKASSIVDEYREGANHE
jgi:hypothetical protein